MIFVTSKSVKIPEITQKKSKSEMTVEKMIAKRLIVFISLLAESIFCKAWIFSCDSISAASNGSGRASIGGALGKRPKGVEGREVRRGMG